MKASKKCAEKKRVKTMSDWLSSLWRRECVSQVYIRMNLAWTLPVARDVVKAPLGISLQQEW